MKTKKFTFDINTWLPVLIFLLILVVFTILTGGSLLSARNLLNIFNQSVATILAAGGMLFVTAMAGTDISTGVVVALAGMYGLMAAKVDRTFCLVYHYFCSDRACFWIFTRVCKCQVKGQFFMASLARSMGYRAVVNLVLSNNAFYLPDDLYVLDNTGVKLIVTVVMLLIIYYIWNFTRLGNYVRGIGENEVAIRHTGVDVDKIKIIAFMISGLMAAVAGIFTVARLGGTSNTMGSGFEMKVMMALFIAGIPVQGGEGSKVYKLIFGAPTIIMLENGLVMCGLDAGVTQLVRGLVLLVAVGLSSQLARKMAYVGQQGAQNQKLVDAAAETANKQ